MDYLFQVSDLRWSPGRDPEEDPEGGKEKRRQTCYNKEVAKHRVVAIVVNKVLTRVTK